MSNTFVRRYGDPSWLRRPVQDQEDTWVMSPPDGDKSYEELELERRHVNIKDNQSASWAFGNPLFILAGSDSTVEVIVNSTSWHLHRALPISRSSLFKSALSDDPKGGMHLSDYVFLPNATAFTLFVQWLYTSTFNALSAIDPLRAYILGSQLGAVGFQNQAIHKVHDMNRLIYTITAGVARIIFELDVGSGLRRLAVDSIALGFLTKELDVKAEEWKEVLGLKNGWPEVMSLMALQYTKTWKSEKPEEYYEVV